MKDSILEKALLQAKVLEEAIKTNAKGILADTMKQEINSLVKESLEDEMSSDEETDMSEAPNPFAGGDDSDDNEDDVTSADENNADVDTEDSDEDASTEDDSFGSDEESDDDASDDESDTDGFGGFPASDDTDDDEDDSDEEDSETIDMTGASDDEVLSVFKKMGEDDGIIVTKNGEDSVELTIDDQDFLVKLNEDDEFADEEIDEQDEADLEEGEDETEMCEEDEEEIEENMDNMNSDDDETLYEIVFDDEDDFSLGSDSELGSGLGGEEPIDDVPVDGLNLDEPSHDDEFQGGDLGDAEFMEIARTVGLGARPNSLPKGAKAATKVSREALSEMKEIKKQNKLLKEKVEEYKKALGLFRDKLNEVAVFNANLAYATRLFTEHSTTKNEKMEILKRFDNTATLKESQQLYKTVKTELNSKPTITETVANKIVKTPANGSTANSKEVLAESKAYTSPQFERMKDLMGKLKK
jgi:hypothetical protein